MLLWLGTFRLPLFIFVRTYRARRMVLQGRAAPPEYSVSCLSDLYRAEGLIQQFWFIVYYTATFETTKKDEILLESKGEQIES